MSRVYLIVKQSSFLNRSLLLSVSIRKTYRMLINPNKTMERKKYAPSSIFNKHTNEKSARFLMALVTREINFLHIYINIPSVRIKFRFERGRRGKNRLPSSFNWSVYTCFSCRSMINDQLQGWMHPRVGDVLIMMCAHHCLIRSNNQIKYLRCLYVWNLIGNVVVVKRNLMWM